MQAQPLVLTANGLHFSAVAAGDEHAPLAILLHGFPQSAYTWRHQLEPLARAGLRVLAPDLRGYMGSSRPPDVKDYQLQAIAQDVLAMADTLAAPQFFVAGHDWGAVLTWWLAQMHPQRVRKAVVVNGPHPSTVLSHALRHPTQLARSAYVGFFQLPLVPEATLRARGFRALRKAMQASAREGTFSDADLDVYQSGWSQDGALTAMLNWYRAIGRHGSGLSRGKSRIEVPVRVLWGDADAALEPGLADAGAALCREASVRHFDGASHWLPEEAPDEITGELVTFFAS